MLPRLLAAAAALLVAAAPLCAQQQPAAPRQIAPNVYLVSDRTGNLLVMTGDDGPLVAGWQSPSLVAQARTLLASLHAPPVRYAFIAAADSAVQWGDGGWGQDGALTIAHEGVRYGIRRWQREHPGGTMGAPRWGFSQVIQMGINGDDVHAIHHPAGFNDSDAVLHYERAGFLYMGALFTTDGYPSIDVESGGTIGGLIKSSTEFVDNFAAAATAVEPIVPGRGPVATLAELRAYRDMLAAIRAAVEPQVRAGKTEQQVIASHPTAPFDAQWGHGPVSAAAFTGMVYRSVVKEIATPPAAAQP